MERRLHIGLLVVNILIGSSCVTSRQERPNPPQTAKPIEKEGQKLPPTPAAPPVPQADLGALWGKVSDPKVELSDSDVREATQLYPAQSGTQEEAIFIMAQIRLFQKDLERRTGFQTQDLYSSDSPAPSSRGLSLEKRFQELDMDLVSAVKGNSFLKNLNALQLIQTLARNTENSPGFTASLNAAITEVGAQWAELSQAGGIAVPPTGSAPEPVPVPTPAPATTGTETGDGSATAATAPTAEADLTQSDSILLMAQRLADKGSFKEAIEQTNRIPAGDPFHQQAQEKTKQYSNRAVQDLRQRAAEAFSNAIPMTDPKAKAVYLRQAKTLLEQALSDFPLADQLDTVKQNLAVITHDLEAVDKSGS